MNIGVFDSGIGGKAVAAALQDTFPSATITTVNDQAHVPYGDKSPDEIRSLTDAAIQPILDNDVIVIACNSATTMAIDWLRERYPTRKFIGIEPMVKPAAAHTTSGVIAVCATPATLASPRYHHLKQTYAANITVLEPDCSLWARMIEDSQVNEESIRQILDELLNKNADVIILGCTHYHWIKDFIVEYVNGRALVLEPSEAIGNRVKQLLDKTA